MPPKSVKTKKKSSRPQSPVLSPKIGEDQKKRSARSRSPDFYATNSKISAEARNGNPGYIGHLKTCVLFFVALPIGAALIWP